MDKLLEYLIKALVEDENSVVVEKEEDEKSVTFVVKVASTDIGKVIGKNGKTANNIRGIMKSVASKTHKKVFVKFGE